MDKVDAGRTGSDDDINEHKVACWNSMYRPLIFHPIVLRPHSPEWSMQIEVRNAISLGSHRHIQSHVHPTTIPSKMALFVFALLGLEYIRHKTILVIEETGESILLEWNHRTEKGIGYPSMHPGPYKFLSGLNAL